MASVGANLQSFSSLISSDPRMGIKVPSTSNSRILDIPCKVCGDNSSGKHYNIFACDGCAGFFKRSIRRNRQYVCKAKVEGSCLVDKTHRNQCRACRLAKCQEAGMNKDAVQHERGPRNSTLRKQQMAMIGDGHSFIGSSPTSSLDLCVPPRLPPPLPISNHGFFNPPTDLPRTPLIFPPPIFISSLLNPAAICESAARLLFMNVHWVKNVPSFTTLSLPDQLLLLEESWRELFVLGVAQLLAPIDLRPLLHACELLQKEPTRTAQFLDEITKFQETVTKIAQFQLDPTEFSCLRAIVLFKIIDKTSEGAEERKLDDAVSVAAVHNHTQLVLSRYLAAVHPAQPLRLQHLLMLLPNLKCISQTTIEELFFRRTIGNIPIVKLICDMYQHPPATS